MFKPVLLADLLFDEEELNPFCITLLLDDAEAEDDEEDEEEEDEDEEETAANGELLVLFICWIFLASLRPAIDWLLYKLLLLLFDD